MAPKEVLISDYKVQVFPRITKSIIKQMIVDLHNLMVQLAKLNLDTTKDYNFLYYILILKYFTNIPMTTSDIRKSIITLDTIIDLNILDGVLNSFSKKQIKSLCDKLSFEIFQFYGDGKNAI